MTREALERHQVWLYLTSIALSWLLGRQSPTLAAGLEGLLWPLLAALLFATFCQTPLRQWRQSLRNRRFLTLAVIGNFVLLPLLVALLLPWVPQDPAIRLGVLLVLLVPCTDWFISFTHLGQGATEDAIAFAPLSLLLQLLLLPLYLSLFLGADARTGMDWGAALVQREMLLAFGGLILLPLLLAFLTERFAWRDHPPRKAALLGALAWLPVPLLALVVGLIAATQAPLLAQSGGILLGLVPVFVAFLLLAAALARLLGTIWHLPLAQTRVLAFSFGTRNSFVVLPLALALPPGMELAAAAIVLQSLVELLGMVLFLWWLPRWRHPS